jgi:hypothetical protein
MQRRSTTQDISWFLDLRRNNQFDLNPPYQRRSVWNLKDRRFFLDTVFRGYPCPPIFLHKTINAEQKTVYAVVDGKQRLQTLFMYVDGTDNISLDSEFGDARFNAKTWTKLEQTEKQIFWDYVIPVEFLIFDANDPQEVNQAFDRLNRNMRKLEAQELRHARWDGWFIKLVESECEDQVWRKLGIVTNARNKRMKDAQFISELILMTIERKQLGFDQQSIDEAYSKYDDLDELDQPVDPDEVKERLAAAKEYLSVMQDTNGVVKDHAGTLAAFYTLWAAVTLHRNVLPEGAAFAAIFADFKNKVDEIEATENPDPLLNGPNARKYKRASDFLQGFRGASTDLTPRAKRLDALLAFVRGE